MLATHSHLKWISWTVEKARLLVWSNVAALRCESPRENYKLEKKTKTWPFRCCTGHTNGARLLLNPNKTYRSLSMFTGPIFLACTRHAASKCPGRWCVPQGRFYSRPRQRGCRSKAPYPRSLKARCTDPYMQSFESRNRLPQLDNSISSLCRTLSHVCAMKQPQPNGGIFGMIGSSERHENAFPRNFDGINLSPGN